MNRIVATCFVFLLVTLSGCNSIPPFGDVEQPKPQISPLRPENSPLPTPSPVTTVVVVANEGEVIPTPDPAKGLIEGTIAMDGHAIGVVPVTLFLGDPTGSEPLGAYVALDIETAPRGYVRPDGTFIFPNIPPGLYVIIAWTPNSAYLVPDPSTGHTWLIEIKDHVRFTTGHIQIPSLGLP